MNRRTLLQALTTFPFLGRAAPAQAASPVTVECGGNAFPKAVYTGYLTWQGLAALLWKNFETHAAGMNFEANWWQEGDLKLMQPICYRFCKYLLATRNEQTGPWGDMAAPYFPNQDPYLIEKNVKFGVLDGNAPEATFEGETKSSASRKIRLGSLESFRQVMYDLRAYHGIDAETEMVDVIGSQAALEVLHEIRSDWNNGCKVRMYALHLPPYVTPTDPKLVEQGFSVCRRWRMRYAKFT